MLLGNNTVQFTVANDNWKQIDIRSGINPENLPFKRSLRRGTNENIRILSITNQHIYLYG